MEVSYIGFDDSFREYAINLSLSGALIASNNPMPLESKPRFSIFFPDKKRLFFSGKVVRHAGKSEVSKMTSDFKAGMGVQFLEADEDYQTYFKNFFSGIDNRKFDRKNLNLKIKYKSVDNFITDYTKNISKGGLLVIMNKKLALGTVLDLVLELPGLNLEAQLRGKVVHHMPVKGSERVGTGIQFVDITSDFEKKMDMFFKWYNKSDQLQRTN